MQLFLYIAHNICTLYMEDPLRHSPTHAIPEQEALFAKHIEPHMGALIQTILEARRHYDQQRSFVRYSP